MYFVIGRIENGWIVLKTFNNRNDADEFRDAVKTNYDVVIIAQHVIM